MRSGLFCMLFLLLLGACTKLSPGEQAMQAARQSAADSYKALLSGRYDSFLSGRADADSLPDDYRVQLLASYKQFMAQQQQSHGGISSFTVTNSRIDSSLHLIQVFVMLQYADSVREEIVVPMIERNGEWKMK